jgi:hypothetical protein
MVDVSLEWARVSPGTVIVATKDRAFAHALVSGTGDPFAAPMEGPGSAATTRRLLDGAIGAAARAVLPAPEPPSPPPLTPERWAWRLSGYHCTTHPTPARMAEASRRFAAQGRAALAAWAATKAREETGHDLLALRDLEALGYAPSWVEAHVPPASRALVEYFAAVTHADDPIGCVGYSYALERLALGRDAGSVAAVQAVLPPGVDATRCLRVHSAVGSDAAHVEETVALVAGLGADERTQIAIACFETALRFHAPPAVAPPTDAELAAILSPHRLAPATPPP